MGHENGAAGRDGWAIPKELPCGCPLVNKSGGRIITHAIKLKDGTRVCRCGRRWKFRLQLDEFKELGLYAE